MAQRYGGKYSPDPRDDDAASGGGAGNGAGNGAGGGAGGTSGGPGNGAGGGYKVARVDPAGARANLMFLPPVILLFTSIFSGAVSLVAGLVGAGALALGAWLLRDGLRAEDEYRARKVARRPAIPRKIFAALLTGIGAGLAAWTSEPGLVAPVLFGLAAAGLHVAAFGIDPLRSKGMEGIDTFQQDRVARYIDEGEARLREMADAARRADDRQVEERVARFAATAREMFRTIEEDPRDLTAARKFMAVYLMGARDATVKFADIYSRTQDRNAKSDYLALLTDLEQSFEKKNRKMLLDNNQDLAIEIDVLRDRLSREGVRLNDE